MRDRAALLAQLLRGLVDAGEHEVAQLVHDLERRLVHAHRAGPQRLVDDRADHGADPLAPRLAEALGHLRRERIGSRTPARIASSASWARYAMRSAKRTQNASGVAGGGSIFHEWARMPSRTSHVRLASSSTSKMRTLCAAWCHSSGAKYGTERLLAGVAERRVADVVAERDRLGQRLVQAQRGRERPGDLGDLHRVRQARDEVVALRVEEDLGLVLQPAEGLRVDDPIPVALERRPVRVRLLGSRPPSRGAPTEWPKG